MLQGVPHLPTLYHASSSSPKNAKIASNPPPKSTGIYPIALSPDLHILDNPQRHNIINRKVGEPLPVAQ